MTELAEDIEQFTVTQKLTLMVNRYEIRSVAGDGQPGHLLAVAQQKRAAFKEQVTFYQDESRTMPLFSFKARQRLDLAATYDVLDASGHQIGSFRKDFGKSLLRSTWHLEASGLKVTGSERSLGVAVGRRIWEATPLGDAIPSPFRFHFDFVDSNGEVLMTSERGTVPSRPIPHHPPRRPTRRPGCGGDGRGTGCSPVPIDPPKR